MAERVHVLISGMVQGVGFRYSAAREARARGVTGWVQNLPDGRVEAEFEGPRDVLDHMVSWCEKGPSYAQVDRVNSEWESGSPRHRTFVIR